MKERQMKMVATLIAMMFAITGLAVAQEIIPNANISGMKFNDLNDNGIKDPGEPGLSNWTIKLSQPGEEFPPTALTEIDGKYIFPGLAPGNYAVSEVIQSGWNQTAPQGGVYNVTLSGEDVTGLDFGNFNTSQAIPEEVRQDEMSDLVAVELIPSTAYPLPGEKINLQLKILNRAVISEQNVEIILLADGKKVGSIVSDFDPESTKTVNLVWQATQGTSKLLAIVDPDHKLTEQNQQDNLISVDVAIAPQPPRGADFAVVDLQTGVGVLRATVNNHGTVAAQAPFVLRADGEIATLQLLEIEPGKSMTIEVPWSTQPSVSQLSGEINPRYRTAEQNPDDNILSKDLRPPIDIRVEGLSVSAEKFNPSRPRQITISFRIVNGGQQDITTPFRTSVFPGIVTDGTLDTFYIDTLLLPAGQTVYVSRTIVSPVGEFDVQVDADVDNNITEVDKSNNIVTAHYKNPSPDVGRWVSIGPSLITNNLGYPEKNSLGVLFSIAVDHTDPSTIYVGSHGSGVWKTSDGGSSWQVITDSLPIMAIAAIAIDPSNPSRIYVASPDYGVFRSEDGGTSWIQLDSSWTPRNIKLQLTGCCEILLVNPNNPDELHLTSLNGVYKSIDRGLTWSISLNTPGQDVTSLVRNSSNPDTLYAGIYKDGIYKTTDDGNTWNKLTSAPLPTTDINKILLSLSQDNPDTIYAIFGKTSGKNFDLFRSDDAGASWSKQSTLSFYIAILGVDPANPDVVYLGGVDFYRSSDGGKNFGVTSGPDGPHADYHGFANHPTDSKVIYVVGDGGIYVSSDQGKSGTWRFIGQGIINVELYDLAHAATDSNMVIGGTQDNGNIQYDASSTVWKMIRGDDGGTVDIDPTNAGIFYTMGQYADSIAKHHGGTIDGFAKNLPTGGGVCFNLHFQVHPSNPSTLLASCDSLWRTATSNPPGDWKKILTPSSGIIRRSAIDPSIDLYYAGANDGSIYAGPGGDNWQNVFVHPYGFGISDIKVDSNSPETVYASFGGTGSARVYRLQRSSPMPTTMTSQDITSNLPTGIIINAIGIDELTQLTIYAGTNKGVYRGHSNDGGATWFWVPYLRGLPLADVRTLVTHPSTKIMRAGTFGRSSFEVTTGPLGTISGTKFNDINGNGIKDSSDFGLKDWFILLIKQSDGTKILTKTDINGDYAFSALDADTYTVEEFLQSGWIQTNPAVSATGTATYVVNISAAENVTGKNFGNFKFGEVHGQKFEDLNANSIKDENETGLTGWNITINGMDTITGTPVNITKTTDINGEYNFTGLTAGTYTITEELKNGWVQTAPITGAYTVTISSGSNITGQDFGNFHKGKMTGGGWISIKGDPKATFGVVGQYPDTKSIAQGNVEYQDHRTNLNIKSTKINTVATTLDKKKGVITGLAQVNNAGSYPFEVYVEDNGDPGKGNDVFKIAVALPIPYSNGAILSGGNIQIHS